MKVIQHWDALGDALQVQDGVPQNYMELEERIDGLPVNFGQVNDKIYRGGIVYSTQVQFLIDRGVRHIISLLDGDWLQSGIVDISDDITQHRFPVLQRRELTAEKILKILDVVWALEEQDKGAVYIHCLKGAVRTSMVIAMYQILRGKHGRFGAILESLPYGNFNLSAIREIMKYPR